MNPLTVKCPHCSASEWQACTVLGTGQPMQISAAHPSRMEAAGIEPEWCAVANYRIKHAADVESSNE